MLVLRLQALGAAVIRLSGATSGRFMIAPSAEPQIIVTTPGGHGRQLRIASEGGGAIEIHGIAVLPEGSADQLRFEPVRRQYKPRRTLVAENAILLEYAGLHHA